MMQKLKNFFLKRKHIRNYRKKLLHDIDLYLPEKEGEIKKGITDKIKFFNKYEGNEDSEYLSIYPSLDKTYEKINETHYGIKELKQNISIIKDKIVILDKSLNKAKINL